MPENEQDVQRLDKWLWAARYFKTRTLAAAAVTGGKVQVDGQRVKPSKLIRAGDRLEIRRGPMQWEIVVSGLSKQRRPAPEAAQLYEETPESTARRLETAERHRQEQQEKLRGGRPTKRDRRRLSDLTGR
jgi:ribosome-associated heat shock protein Hsp15